MPRDAVDPIYGEKAYVLLPEGEVTKPYRLLAATMEKSGRTGIATFVLRGREVAIAIHAERGILYGETLRHPDEIRSAEAVGLPTWVEPDGALVKRFVKAIKAADERGLDTRALNDEGAAALRALAEKKRKQHQGLVEVPVEDKAERGGEAETLAPILDIVALLKVRLGGGKAASATSEVPAKKAAPRRKTAHAGATAKAKPEAGSTSGAARRWKRSARASRA